MLIAAEGIFTRSGLANFGFRWLHVLFGVAWIGLLYYFNFVQVPAFAAYGDEARARNVSIDKLARKALWYFRWASVATVVTGLLIMGLTEKYFEAGLKDKGVSAISLGALMAIVMFLNVWGVIWRNQKTVLANAANVLGGGEANPGAAGAGRAALMASRQNAIFSIAMLFFMVYKGHAPRVGEMTGGKTALFWIVSLVIIAVMELNALGMMPWKRTANKGLNAMYDGKGVQNPMIAASALAVFFVIWTEICFS
jgi:uncharacterized membrane protein